ncbi:hypothetical protein [Streptomyces sp. NPDC007905]|uniref:hypothetical protein n=1 Tax=Streptomyces sp. NPDC007905 TaxID=3364788 RepID=UPI0036E99C77
MSHNTPQPDHTPVVPGFIEDHDQGQSLRVWCRWCCIWHEHGHTGTEVGDTTDRAAHCFAPDGTVTLADRWDDLRVGQPGEGRP